MAISAAWPIPAVTGVTDARPSAEICRFAEATVVFTQRLDDRAGEGPGLPGARPGLYSTGMRACLRTFATLLLAIASLAAGMTPALARAVAPAGAACAGTAHSRETPSGSSSVHQASTGCGQCERGCSGPGQCVTSASLAPTEASAPWPFPRASSGRYEVASEPLRSTTAAPPNPPPQPLL